MWIKSVALIVHGYQWYSLKCNLWMYYATNIGVMLWLSEYKSSECSIYVANGNNVTVPKFRNPQCENKKKKVWTIVNPKNLKVKQNSYKIWNIAQKK